jgi:hypothetical protein
VGLLDVANRSSSPDAGHAALLTQISEALKENRSVFYLRTQWEEDVAGWGDYYLRYIDAIDERFVLSETFRSTRENTNGHYWSLLEISRD